MSSAWLEGAHPHLLLNHVPVVLAPCALLLLLSSAWFKSRHLERAGLVACIAVALCALPTYWTGEPAEDAVHGLAGVSGPWIEEHEEAGSFALLASIVLGVIAIGSLALALKKGSTPRSALAATALLAAWSAFVLARTANLGGQIRHSEIREAAAAPADPRP